MSITGRRRAADAAEAAQADDFRVESSRTQQFLGSIGAGTAPQDVPVRAAVALGGPRGKVNYSVLDAIGVVMRMQPVIAPLLCVARYVVKTVLIRRIEGHWRGGLPQAVPPIMLVRVAAALIVCLAPVNSASPGITGVSQAAPGGILPFGLRGESVAIRPKIALPRLGIIARLKPL